MASSKASNASDADLSDMTGVSSKAGKRGRVASGLGEAAEQELVSKAKKRVLEAMNGDSTLALKIDFLITSGKLGKARKTEGAAAMLPSCSNKYHLIGKERIIELLLRLRPALQKDALLEMDLDHLQRLQRFGLRLSDKCAVPTRAWQHLLEEARARYEELGGNRLDKVRFTKKAGANMSTMRSTMPLVAHSLWFPRRRNSCFWST